MAEMLPTHVLGCGHVFLKLSSYPIFVSSIEMIAKKQKTKNYV